MLENRTQYNAECTAKHCHTSVLKHTLSAGDCGVYTTSISSVSTSGSGRMLFVLCVASQSLPDRHRPEEHVILYLIYPQYCWVKFYEES